MGWGQARLEVVINVLGWFCGLLALFTPVWFAAAAAGTKWSFWSWQFGLQTMILHWGPNLLLACLVTAVFAAVAITIYRIIFKEFFGVISAPILALLVGLSGGGWMYVAQTGAAEAVSVLDVTTDPVDPPHFTTGFAARRSLHEQPLDYDGKSADDGRPIYALQQEAYPQIQPVIVDAPPDRVFRQALLLAREEGWQVGAASETAGMFEAGAESFWFGFRDDIVVRIRETEEGGCRIDMRSLARTPIDDHGRNARRVEEFLEQLAAL